MQSNFVFIFEFMIVKVGELVGSPVGRQSRSPKLRVIELAERAVGPVKRSGCTVCAPLPLSRRADPAPPRRPDLRPSPGAQDRRTCT